MNTSNEALLEHVDGYIVAQTQKLMRWYLVSSSHTLDSLEIDELAQRVRIKFWKSLEKGIIFRPYSYIKRVIFSEFIDMKRQQKLLLPLPVNEEEEEYVFQRQEDPADEVIQRLDADTLLERLVQLLLELPPRQQMAVIYLLWDQVDDPTRLLAVLATHGLQVDVVQWPLEKAQRQVLLASLSVARRKLAQKRVS